MKVVARIIKHSQEARANSATGLLLGLDLDGTLEVTNSFALPPSSSHASESDDDKTTRSSQRYQASMLRALKDIQGDDNVVGFYQATSLGNFISSTLVDMQSIQHEKLRHRGIVIVHGRLLPPQCTARFHTIQDSSQGAGGNANFRAFRLTDKFVEVYKSGRFTSQQ